MEHRHPGDARDLEIISKPPTSAQIENVRDLIVIPTSSRPAAASDPPAAGDPPFDLGFGVILRHADHAESDLVINACAARGHYFVPARQFGGRLVYERAIEPDVWATKVYQWDSEQVLNKALALSRFVRDNAHDIEFAARVIDYSDGARQVIPGAGFGARAGYRLGIERDWLDVAEAAALRNLLAAFIANEDTFPDRVKRAIWLIDWISGEHYLDITLPLLVTAGEALTNTSSDQVMRQFSARLTAMASELKLRGVSKTFCNELYEARSQATHGARVGLFTDVPNAAAPDDVVPPSEAVREKIMRLQILLRTVLRKAIEDPGFAAHFADEKAIRARWPVTNEL